MNSLMFAILISVLIYSTNPNWTNSNFENKNSYEISEASKKNIKNCFPKISNDTTKKNIEDIILDKIYNIPEVRKKEHFIDSLTNHKHGISMMILKRPTTKEPYYAVQVGYDNKIRFETYYTFYVYRKNLVIKFYDTIPGEVITLEEWRKRNRY